MFCSSLISVMSSLATLSVCIVLLAPSASTAPVLPTPTPTVPSELDVHVQLYSQEGCKGSEEQLLSIKLKPLDETSGRFESECRSLLNVKPGCAQATPTSSSMTDFDMSIELFGKDTDCRRENRLEALPTNLNSTVMSFRVVAYPKSKSS